MGLSPIVFRPAKEVNDTKYISNLFGKAHFKVAALLLLRALGAVLGTASWLWPISLFDGINNPGNEEINYYYPTTDLAWTERIAEALGAPAFMENDANACALAEWRWGAGQGCRSMAFLTFGTGLGAGLILDGRLYRGACGMAGELGHWRLSDYGPTGYGKEGSFEGFCSGGGIRLPRCFFQK